MKEKSYLTETMASMGVAGLLLLGSTGAAGALKEGLEADRNVRTSHEAAPIHNRLMYIDSNGNEVVELLDRHQAFHFERSGLHGVVCKDLSGRKVTVHSNGRVDPERLEYHTFETEFYRDINEYRESIGIGRVLSDPNLDFFSEQHVQVNAELNCLSHDRQLLEGMEGLNPDSKVGEILGYVPAKIDAEHSLALLDAFLNSLSHAAIIQDPVYQYFGIGVEEVEGGFFVTVRFARYTPPADQEARVAPALGRLIS